MSLSGILILKSSLSWGYISYVEMLKPRVVAKLSALKLGLETEAKAGA